MVKSTALAPAPAAGREILAPKAPLAVPPPPVTAPGRYHLHYLLRRLIQLKPAQQHAALLSGEFSLEEVIALRKAFNGLEYHIARRYGCRERAAQAPYGNTF